MRRVLRPCLAAIVLLTAGCAAPEEARSDPFPAITIDGAVYYCDDTLDLDGACDEYERAEEGIEATDGAYASSDGLVDVGGDTYACSDLSQADVDVGVGMDDGTSDVGTCDTYERVRT